MTELVFVVPDALKDVAREAGILSEVPAIEPCSLHLGDVISYPDAPRLAFRVVGMAYRAADETTPARWFISLVATPWPPDDQDRIPNSAERAQTPRRPELTTE